MKVFFETKGKVKERPIAIAVFSLLTISALAMLSWNLLRPVPQITEVIPADFTKSEFLLKDTLVEIKGNRFTEKMDLYIDGMKLEQYTYTDENNISFEMPEAFYEKGANVIYLKNQTGWSSFIPSNRYQLEMNPSKVVKPLITDASIEEVSALTAHIHIQGERFNEKSAVSINGQVQTDVIFHSEQSLSFKIKVQDWLQEESLSFVVFDTANYQARSNVYKLENPSQPSEKNRIQSDLAYLKNGYLIAHAFGEYDGRTYTNSLEAFEHNYNAGHRLFEVDFQFTKDDILATLHDKPRTDMDAPLYDKELEIGTFDEEQVAVPYTLLTFEQLCKLMVKYDDIYIITDSKYRENMTAVKNTADAMVEIINKVNPELINRFVIQVYTQEMYHFLSQNYPFVSYIYTLYTSPDTDDEVVEFVKKTGIPVVTMWHYRATPEFVDKLRALGVYTFVHTVNEASAVNDFMQRGVYGAYTDSLKYSDFSTARTERFSTMNREDVNVDLRMEALKSYIAELGRTDTLQVVFDKGQAMAALPAEIVPSFSSYSTTNEPYRFFIKQGEKTLYQGASAEALNTALSERFGMELSISVNELNVTISKVEYPISAQGLLFLKLNPLNNSLDDAVFFDAENGFRMMRLDAARVNNRKVFERYLDSINQDKYMLMFAVADEGSGALDDELQQKLAEMGLRLTLKGAYRNSYIAIINGGKVVAEELSEDLIEKTLLVEDWIVKVKSGAYEVGNIASIQVDGIEHARNRRGLNIVVFDKTIGRAVDSVCFDTCEGVGKYPD